MSTNMRGYDPEEEEMTEEEIEEMEWQAEGRWENWHDNASDEEIEEVYGDIEEIAESIRM